MVSKPRVSPMQTTFSQYGGFHVVNSIYSANNYDPPYRGYINGWSSIEGSMKNKEALTTTND
jgi:hypothetical protein